jgi:hypothetical protein
MRHANHGSLNDAGQCVDLDFDRFAGDIQAPTDDVVSTANDAHVAAAVDLAEITGDKETVGSEFRLGLFRRSPITGEQLRPAHFDDANLSVRQRPTALRVGDAQLRTSQGQADCSRTTFPT